MIWVLYGEDEFRRSERRKALQQELLGDAPADFALTVWRGKAFGEQTFPQLYELPFLASHKVVVLLEAEVLGKAEFKLLTHYCQQPAAHTRLIIDFGQAQKPPLPQKPEITYEEFAPLRPKEVIEWLLQKAQELRLALHPEAATLLVELLGTDLRLLSQALNTFSVYRGDSDSAPLTPNEISEALGLHPQYTIYKLIDAIAEGDTGAILRIGAAFAEDTRTHPLAQVIWHLRSFYQNVAYLHLSRTPPTTKAIQERLGLRFPFQARPYERALPRLSLQACEYALHLLRSTDARQKGVIPSRQSERQLFLGLIEKLAKPPTPAIQ